MALQGDAVQPWTTLGIANLTHPSWLSAYLRQKSASLESAPPLSQSIPGFGVWHQRLVDPAMPTADSLATRFEASCAAGHSFWKAGSAIAEAETAEPSSAGGVDPADWDTFEDSLAAQKFKLVELLNRCRGRAVRAADPSQSSDRLGQKGAPLNVAPWCHQANFGNSAWSRHTSESASTAAGSWSRLTSESAPIAAGYSAAGQELSCFASAGEAMGLSAWSRHTSESAPTAAGSWATGHELSCLATAESAATTKPKPTGADEGADGGGLGEQHAAAAEMPWPPGICGGQMNPQEIAWRHRDSKEITKRLELEGPAALMASAPLDEGGIPTSLGSTGHAAGSCRPCAYAFSQGGCDAGVLCRFCHFKHPGRQRVRARPCKGRRERYRKLVSKLAAQLDEDPDAFDPDDDRLPPSIKFDHRMKAKLSTRLSLHSERARTFQEPVLDGAS